MNDRRSTTVIRRATAADLDQLATVLAAAFADSPWTRWCVAADHHARRLTELQRLSLELVGLPYGLVWLAEDDGAVVSTGAWSDSRIGLDRSILVQLADRSRPWHGDRLQAAMLAEQHGFPRPVDDHLFLETMGTVPDQQRRGFGSAVLGPGLQLADDERLVCALETSTTGNVAFYRSLGFETVHHRVVPDGGPDVWSMWRAPRRHPLRLPSP